MQYDWDYDATIEICEPPLCVIKGTRIDPEKQFTPDNMTPDRHLGYIAESVKLTVGYEIDRCDEGFFVVSYEIDTMSLYDFKAKDYAEVPKTDPAFKFICDLIDRTQHDHVIELLEVAHAENTGD